MRGFRAGPGFTSIHNNVPVAGLSFQDLVPVQAGVLRQDARQLVHPVAVAVTAECTLAGKASVV